MNIFKTIMEMALGSAILFYLMAYVIIPSFNLTYVASITGLSPTVLQGILFILLLVILFGFVYTFLRISGMVGSGKGK